MYALSVLMLLTIGVAGAETGAGSIAIHIDQGHANYHTLTGRFAPFARLLRDHGYLANPFDNQFSSSSLQDVEVLVVANALHAESIDPRDWRQPVNPAFTAEEVTSIVNWVSAGGRLLLIADHMPFAGAAFPLADALGFELFDGFVLRNEFIARPDQSDGNIMQYRWREGELIPADTRWSGLGMDGWLNWGAFGTHSALIAAASMSVATFTGHAFRPKAENSGDATGILIIGDTAIQVFPVAASDLRPDMTAEQLSNMRKAPARGLWQGAVKKIGNGRVAIFAEAGMFTDQRVDLDGQQVVMGFDHPSAKNNRVFIKTLMAWLTEGLRQ